MKCLSIFARLILSGILAWTMADLSQLVGERLAMVTASTELVERSPIIQTRRSMMERIAAAKVRGRTDRSRGEAELLSIFSAARDPQIRERAGLYLLELTVNDWPNDYRRDFLATIAPAALESARTHQLPPSVILAQAVLESGWGRSLLARRHHNLFGVKAANGQASATFPTLEASAKGVHVRRAAFRTFDSTQESIVQHGMLIASDQRYASARSHAGNWRQFLAELAPVYASDPHYARQLTQIIRTYGLDRWDGLIQGDLAIRSS